MIRENKAPPSLISQLAPFFSVNCLEKTLHVLDTLQKGIKSLGTFGAL